MVRLFMPIALAALTTMSAMSLDARLAARAGDVDDCFSLDEGYHVIRGCTRIINSRELDGKPISNSDLAVVYHQRGQQYHLEDQYEAAKADYEQAIKLDPTNSNYYVSRGEFYEEAKQDDRALADFSKAITLDPTNAIAYIYRGVIYELRGDKERAIADYRKILELEPGNEAVIESLRKLGGTP